MASRSSSSLAQTALSVKSCSGIIFQLVLLICPSTTHFFFLFSPSLEKMSGATGEEAEGGGGGDGTVVTGGGGVGAGGGGGGGGGGCGGP